jgi:tetratricopeptide (TPR) repeat protein
LYNAKREAAGPERLGKGTIVKFQTLTLMAGVLLAQSALAQETALPELREAAKRAPTDAQAQIALGRALIKAGQLAEAEVPMRAAVRLSKGSIESLYEAMRPNFASDNYRKARAGCQELVKKDKNHVLSEVCLARAFLVWRRSSRAFEHIEQALRLDPSNYEARLAFADAKRIQGELDAASEAYEEALKQNPKGAEAKLGLGLTYALQNKLEPALTALREADALDPGNPEIELELGQRLKGPESVAMLQEALAGRPKWPAAELALAIAQLRAGDAQSAETALEAFLKRDPNSPVAVAHHGAALVALGRYPEAEPVLRKALVLVPNDYVTSLALAQLYEHTNRAEEAFTQYRSTADLKHESPEPLIAAAKLALSLKRPVLATALLDKALERTPRLAELHALYGDALKARGETKAAREHYQHALQGEGPLDRVALQKRLAELK